MDFFQSDTRVQNHLLQLRAIASFMGGAGEKLGGAAAVRGEVEHLFGRAEQVADAGLAGRGVDGFRPAAGAGLFRGELPACWLVGDRLLRGRLCAATTGAVFFEQGHGYV